MIIKIIEWTSRAEVDVAVTSIHFELGYKLPWSAIIPGLFGLGLRTRKWSGFWYRRKRKDTASGRRGVRLGRGSIRDCGGLGRRLSRIVVLLLRKKRKSKKRSNGCCCTPLTHKYPP